MPSQTGSSFRYQHPDFRVPDRGYGYLKETGGTVNASILADITGGLLNIGDTLHTNVYRDTGYLGGANYQVVAAATGTDDGGSFIDAGTLQLQAVFGNTVDVAQFGANTLDAGAGNVTAINAAIAYLGSITAGDIAGGTVTVSERLLIDDTIVVNNKAITVESSAGGFAHAQLANSANNSGMDQGSFRWAGPAGIPMVQISQTLGATWRLPMQGSSVAIGGAAPISYIDILDPGVNLPDNQATRIERCRLGGVGQGSTGYRAENGIRVLGSTGNDRLFLDGVEIVGVTDVGIDFQNPNAIWTSIRDVLVSGDDVQCPVGLRSVTDLDITNLNFNRCDLAIDVPSASPSLTIHGLHAEHCPQIFLGDNSGSRLAVYGGRILCRGETIAAGHVPIPEDGSIIDMDLNDGGTCVLENVLFLGLEFYAVRPHLDFTAVRGGGGLRLHGCGQLRRTDVAFALGVSGTVLCDCLFVGDHEDLGTETQLYDGDMFRGLVANPATTMPSDINSRPDARVHEFHEDGPAVVYNAGTGDGETNRAFISSPGTVSKMWFVSADPVALDGTVDIELVNITNPFATAVTMQATAGTFGRHEVPDVAVAENDLLVMRITGLLATNANKITLGFEVT